MSVEAMGAVFNHSSACGTAKVVLLGIANHEGDGGSWPSIATLSTYANADRRTVQRAIEKLIEIGELARIVNGGGGRYTPATERPNLYRVLVVCPPDCDGTARHQKRRVPPPAPAALTPPRGADAAPPRGADAARTIQEPSLSTDPEVPHVGNRASGHRHSFDEVSGYCGCGYRDDGRLVDPKSGTQYQPPLSERTSA